MIIDSSALVAVFLREKGFDGLLDAMASATALGVAAPTLSETGIVLSARYKHDAKGLVRRFVSDYGIAVVPFGEAHWQATVAAFARYGKGRHKAALNFGDCMSYATAKLAARPLLFVGDDFSKTDLVPGLSH